MAETNADIRRKLRLYAGLFVSQNCQYQGGENAAAEACIRTIQPVNPECEKYNASNPNHGLPIQGLSKEVK